MATRGSSEQRETLAPDAAPDRIERPFDELRHNLENLRDTLAPLRDLGKRRSADPATGTYLVDSQPPA